MDTECTSVQVEFEGLGRRRVQGAFNGGHLSSDGGAVLLREVDARLGITEGLAGCFTDHRDPELVEHSVLDLVRQRVYGLALGYADLNDHDDLKWDPVLALALGKDDVEGARRHRPSDRGKPLASSSTLNRLELTPADADRRSRYKKVVHHPDRLEGLFVELFLDSFQTAPEEVVLDFDATDDPVHGEQEGKFFHGYYRQYCYLPLYVTCGQHLLVAKLRTADRDGADGSTEVLAELVARIRARWPEVRIIARGDSGFARDGFMTWCESHQVHYLLGLARNQRLVRKLGPELVQARERYEHTGHAARVFSQFEYRTRKSWSRARRVVGKAEHLAKGPNPRFILTNLENDYADPQALYETHYCARGDMENRIKEQQLDLFADRTSASSMRANQLRLWFSSYAYVLLSALRRVGLKGSRLAHATCGTIRMKLLKLGAQLTVTVRRIRLAFASACPYQDVFHHALHTLHHYPLRC
jgi:hypothetical protein